MATSFAFGAVGEEVIKLMCNSMCPIFGFSSSFDGGVGLTFR
jgi:hypothetical protein